MKILFISDTHTKHALMTKDILEYDVDTIVHSGDISSKGYSWEIENFLTWFASLPFKNKIFIAGNHDFLFQEYPSDAQNILSKYPTITYLQNSEVTIDGIKFWGSPATPYFFDWAFNYQRGEDINKIWKTIPNDVDVLITHGPPYKHGDEVEPSSYNPEIYVGCKDLLTKIEEVKPKIHVFGHIHSGHGITENQYTKFINASLLNERYEYFYEPILIEL